MPPKSGMMIDSSDFTFLPPLDKDQNHEQLQRQYSQGRNYYNLQVSNESVSGSESPVKQVQVGFKYLA